MKTIIFIMIWLIITASPLKFFLTKPVDYRDIYCGTYSCKKVQWHLNSDRTHILIDTALASITLSKNAIDSVVNVITPEGTLLLKLTNSLLIPVNSQGRYYGRVTTDSVIFNFKFSQAPPLYRYYGKK